jgi:integrase
MRLQLSAGYGTPGISRLCSARAFRVSDLREVWRIQSPQATKSWRTAWRKLTAKAGLKGFRFHDLRHQAITELAENGVADATLMGMAGHLSRKMMEHYSHVRMDAKRKAVSVLESGLMQCAPTIPINPTSAPL